MPDAAEMQTSGVSRVTGLANSLGIWLRSENVRRRLRVILVYLTGQGLVQFSNLLVGFLLLRWLSVEDYAQFIVAFTFQLTMGFLTDLGFSGTIVALVGPRGDDPAVIGSYIRSGRHMRNMMLLGLTPIAGIFYIQIVRQHHWAPLTSVLLFASIVASIYASGTVAYYGAPLLIKGHLTRYYRHQLVGAIFRFATCGVLYLAGFLSAWTTSWVNALGFFIIGWLFTREACPLVSLPAHSSRQTTRQMLSYFLPNLPSYLFFALQGQIALYLISYFGVTRSIAEVGALGRVGQLFLLLSGFNGVVIEPFMARQPEHRVLRTFLLIAGTAAAVCIPISMMGFLHPKAILLLLGPKYATLMRETGWLILSACVGYLSSVIWIMTTARRWIYWTTTATTITVTLGTQILFLFHIRVDDTMNAILFGLATNLAYLAAALLTGIYGFIRGPRVKIDEASSLQQAVQHVAQVEQGLE